VRAQARANEAINYAQKGCAMQNRGMTLKSTKKEARVLFLVLALVLFLLVLCTFHKSSGNWSEISTNISAGNQAIAILLV